MDFHSYILRQYSIWVWGGSIILVTLLVQTILFYVFKRLYSSHIEKTEHNEISLLVFQVTGTIYAVLLGLLNYVALSNFQVMRDTISVEANQIGNIYRNTNNILDRQTIKPIEQMVFHYLNQLIHYELRMEKSDLENPHLYQKQGWFILNKLSEEIVKAPIDDDIKAKIMSNLNSIYDARRSRINAHEFSLPNIIWVVSGSSIFLMLVNIAICSCHSLGVNIFTSYLFVLSLCLVLIVTIDLDRPFAGTIQLSDEAYVVLYDEMLESFGVHYLIDGTTLAIKEKENEHL